MGKIQHKNREGFTIGEALKNPEQLIYMPLFCVLKEDRWRVPYVCRYGFHNGFYEVLNSLYVGAVERLKRLAPERDINASFVILCGWNSVLKGIEKGNRNNVDIAGGSALFTGDRDNDETPDDALIYEDEYKEDTRPHVIEKMRELCTKAYIPPEYAEALAAFYVDRISGKEVWRSYGFSSYEAFRRWVNMFNVYVKENYTEDSFSEYLGL